jgi:hypothetical protein
MRRTAPLALVVFGLVAPVALAQTQERAGLKIALKTGDQLGYTYTWTLEQKRELPGMPMPPETSEVCYHLDQKVESVTDGVATVQATITSIKVRLGAGMMGEMTYDSATDDASNPFAWLRHVVGEKLTFKMKTTGEVTELTGGGAIRDKVTAAVAREAAEKPAGGGMDDGGGMMGMDPAMMMQMIASRLMVVFTDQSLKSSLEVVNHVLPESGTAADGATWSHPVVETLPNVGTLRFTGEFAHRGSARDAVRITTRASDEIQLERDGGEPSDDPQTEMFRQMQKQMSENMEVKKKTVNGTSSFDVARGRLIDSELVHEIVMEGPLPPMMAAMLGDQAKDAKLKESVLLTLRYVLDEAPATPAPTQPTPGQGGKPGGR